MDNKQKKKNHILAIILIIILLITIILNINILIKQKNNQNTPQTQNRIIEVVSDKKTTNKTDNSSNIANQSNSTIENKTSNIIKNEITNTVSQNISNTDSIVVDFTDDLNMNEVKHLIENYAVGIQRISFEEENLESNTILLFIAKEYFDSNSNKSTLEINTNFAPTATNIHKYLSELTGKDYSNVEYIDTYKNYISYANNSKSYVYGKNYNDITKEIYKCTNIELLNDDNGLYTAKANIIRTVNNQDTNYEITFTFTVNSNYTYEKYCIKSLKVKNTSFYPDNTVHLVDTSSIEEDENR